MRWETGQALRPLAKPEFTREQLREYAVAAADHNPIHLEDKFAQESGFPSVIVHGMLSMAFLADHLAFNFPASAFKVARFKVRFRKVTYPGDTLTCEGEVKKAFSDGKLTVTVRTKNQQGEVTTEGDADILPV